MTERRGKETREHLLFPNGTVRFSAEELLNIEFQMNLTLDGSRRIGSGGFQVPASRIPSGGRQMQIMQRLGGEGVYKIDDKTEPGGFGQFIVRQQGNTLTQKIEAVDFSALVPVIRFNAENPQIVDRVDLFPNASSNERKVNGVQLHINPQTPKWWQKVASLNMPYGRGVITAELPITGEQFCTDSGGILARVHNLARVMDQGGLKYVEFAFDEEKDRIVMVVASGPTDTQRTNIQERLRAIHRPSEFNEFIGDIGLLFTHERHNQLGVIAQAIGVTAQVEPICNIQYVFMDPSLQSITSGGVTGENGIRPFADGVRSIYLLPETPDIRPIGVRPTIDQKPELPPTMNKSMFRLPITQKPVDLTPHISPDDIALPIIGIGHSNRWIKK